jgi:hypothetical protein
MVQYDKRTCGLSHGRLILAHGGEFLKIVGWPRLTPLPTFPP